MSNSLEERLRANSNAFEGLLALIPAKYYYDEDTQEQWKAKKKSKSQAKDDKQRKLDPDMMDQGNMSTLEVMKQRESSSKPVVLPGEKLKQQQQQQEKEVPESQPEGAAFDVDSSVDAKEEDVGELAEIEEDRSLNVIFDDEGNQVSETGEEVPVVQPEPKLEKHDTLTGKQEKKKNIDALRSKLQAKIQDLKEKRKAPGSKAKGSPSSREAILAERKRKLESKRENQQQQKEDVNESDNSDSELDDESDNENSEQQKKKRKLSKEDDDLASGVMFQNITFNDGNRLTSDLQNLRKGTKKKGPAKNDIKSHLKLVEAKRNKLESKDELDQIKFKEKEKWQRAMLQAEGVKIKDNEKLLRKALKRKEAKKRKSSLDWKERQRVVTDTKAEKQKRREENLQIRKDNKGVKRSKQQKMKRKFNGSVAPKKSRAGFEGRLKSGKKK